MNIATMYLGHAYPLRNSLLSRKRQFYFSNCVILNRSFAFFNTHSIINHLMMKEQKKLQSDFRITQYISVYLSSDSYLYQRCISFTSISTQDKELKKKKPPKYSDVLSRKISLKATLKNYFEYTNNTEIQPNKNLLHIS